MSPPLLPIRPCSTRQLAEFAVADTAANIQVDLAALNADAANIVAITAMGGVLSVNLSTFAANQAGLNNIVGGFNVTDVVTKVQANLAALQSDASHIGAITATYGSVSASVTTFMTDRNALNEIVGGFGSRIRPPLLRPTSSR